MKLQNPPHLGFNLSRDERYVLFSQIDRMGSDLMLAEGIQ
jgi:hypothetical protein